MGWMSISQKVDDPKAFLDERMSGPSHEIVRSGVKGNTYFAATRINADNPEKPQPVVAIVVIFNRKGGEFSYKDMDETVHPFYYDCPKRVFQALTPIEELKKMGILSGFAMENTEAWRTHVQALYNNPMKNLAVGDEVHFEKPIRFSDGTEGQNFRKVSVPRKKGIFQDMDSGQLVRLSGKNLENAVLYDPELHGQGAKAVDESSAGLSAESSNESAGRVESSAESSPTGLGSGSEDSESPESPEPGAPEGDRSGQVEASKGVDDDDDLDYRPGTDEESVNRIRSEFASLF